MCLFFSPAKSFLIELKIKIILLIYVVTLFVTARSIVVHRVNKDIPTLKIELSVKRQNDQKQKEQLTFYFSEKSITKSIKSLKS
jgi:hypothetical protein